MVEDGFSVWHQTANNHSNFIKYDSYINKLTLAKESSSNNGSCFDGGSDSTYL